jgi:hypothetical protein
MDKFQFFVEWYNREEERKSSVENSLNIPIGILTILFAIQFYLVKDFDFSNCQNWEKYTLLLLAGISTLSSLATGFFIFKSYHNFPNEYKYSGIPYPTQLLNYEKDLIEFYKVNSEHFNNVTGEQMFNEYLLFKLAQYVDRNTFNNDEKYRYLSISKRLMAVATIAMVIAFFPFLTNLFSKPAKPQQIEVVNFQSIDHRLERIENILILNQNENDNERKTKTTDTTSSTTRQAD